MGRKPCCDKVGLKRGPWTIEEDRMLMNFVLGNGIHCWRTVPKLAGLLRCGKSCRLRWINYLRPDLKRGGFTEAEEDQIIQLHASLGNRWSKIASHFDGRTDNEIKNHWNTRIKKRLRQMGVDPLSHKSANEQKLQAPKNEVSAALKVEKVQTQNEASEDVANNILAQPANLFNNYDIFNGRLEEIEHWLNEDSFVALDGQSSSASLQESLNTSMSEFSPELLEKQNSNNIIQDDPTYLNQWFDEMDSFFGFSYHQDNQLP